MISKVHSASHLGIDGFTVEVEVDLTPGTFHYVTVGLPDTAVKESQNRILSALKNSGFEPPIKKITVNLAPADVRKEGSAFDLPIALAILAAQGLIPAAKIKNLYLTGELALDGRVKPVRGTLSKAVAVRDSGPEEDTIFITPTDNGREAAVVDGITVIPVKTLADCVAYLNDELDIPPAEPELIQEDFIPPGMPDFSDVKGQSAARRAVEVAVAGGHNILMIGSPGAGKSMIAKRIPGIMPGWSLGEAIDISRVHSVADLMPPGRSLISGRPFRSPHHTVSDAGLVGGGNNPINPGEVSLAHHGVLFLDELPEFRRSALEVLRQPMEDGELVISRASYSVKFPADFMLVAAMNPCPCGYLSDPVKECRCTPPSINRYRQKISGPLLDRIDIHIDVPTVKYKEISDNSDSEPSAAIRERVAKARELQQARFGGNSKIIRNGQMGSREIKEYCQLTPDGEKLIRSAMERLGLSARGYTKTLKLARTIADLEGETNISTPHLAEAIQFRSPLG